MIEWTLDQVKLDDDRKEFDQLSNKDKKLFNFLLKLGLIFE